MNKKLVGLVILIILFLITSCSSTGDQTTDMDQKSSDTPTTEEDDTGTREVGEDVDEDADADVEEANQERKVIHQAELYTSVEDLDKAEKKIEQFVHDYEGYTTNSNMYQETDEEARNGHITVRIPEKNFQDFLNDIEDEVLEVVERDVSGTDVTEEYVDLEARLKSKQAVEERLLNFMEDAEKTEDLLKISEDLDEVQGEVEALQGKMNYLESQIDYATVNISMTEDSIDVPSVNNKDLNTWEKTKKQVATSVNFILWFASGMFVMIVGSLPVLIPLAIIGVIIYYIVRKQGKKRK